MKTTLVLVQIFLSYAFATPHFQHINNYQDKNCPKWNISRFTDIQDYIFFGVSSAKKYGYTYGFPISRKGVDDLWCAVEYTNGHFNKACASKRYPNPERLFQVHANKPPVESEMTVSYIDREEQFNDYFSYVTQVIEAEGMGRVNVGAVLEILSRKYLQSMSGLYPKSEYKITSGVEYAHSKSSNTVGELDIIVYDKVTCSVVALGESKASSNKAAKKSLSKARKQIKRFTEFVRRYN